MIYPTLNFEMFLLDDSNDLEKSVFSPFLNIHNTYVLDLRMYLHYLGNIYPCILIVGAFIYLSTYVEVKFQVLLK